MQNEAIIYFLEIIFDPATDIVTQDEAQMNWLRQYIF